MCEILYDIQTLVITVLLHGQREYFKRAQKRTTSTTDKLRRPRNSLSLLMGMNKESHTTWMRNVAALAVCSTRNTRIFYVWSKFYAEQTAAFKTRPFDANDRNQLCNEKDFVRP